MIIYIPGHPVDELIKNEPELKRIYELCFNEARKEAGEEPVKELGKKVFIYEPLHVVEGGKLIVTVDFDYGQITYEPPSFKPEHREEARAYADEVIKPAIAEAVSEAGGEDLEAFFYMKEYMRSRAEETLRIGQLVKCLTEANPGADINVTTVEIKGGAVPRLQNQNDDLTEEQAEAFLSSKAKPKNETEEGA